MTDTVRLGPLEFQYDGRGVGMAKMSGGDGEMIGYGELLSSGDWAEFAGAAAARPAQLPAETVVDAMLAMYEAIDSGPVGIGSAEGKGDAREFAEGYTRGLAQEQASDPVADARADALVVDFTREDVAAVQQKARERGYGGATFEIDFVRDCALGKFEPDDLSLDERSEWFAAWRCETCGWLVPHDVVKVEKGGTPMLRHTRVVRDVDRVKYVECTRDGEEHGPMAEVRCRVVGGKPERPPRTRLIAFLFRMMRDDVPTGVVEEHVRVVEDAHDPDGVADFIGAKGLAAYALELAGRLVP